MSTSKSLVSTSETQEPELPVPAMPQLNLREMYARTTEIAQTERFIASGQTFLKSRDLIGLPFVFLDTGMVRTRVNKKRGDSFEVYQAYIAFVNMADGSISNPQLMGFTGRYIVNQLRERTRRDLVGSYIFTVAPNPDWERLDDGSYPLGIARYVHGTDRPPEEVAVFDEPETSFTRQNGKSSVPSPAERGYVEATTASRGRGRPRKELSDSEMLSKQQALSAVQNGASLKSVTDLWTHAD